MYNPEIVEIEEEVSGVLGTRVHIEKKEKGGKIEIDFFDEESLQNILSVIRANKKREDPFASFPQSNVVDSDVVAESTGDLNSPESETATEIINPNQNNFSYQESKVAEEVTPVVSDASAGSEQTINETELDSEPEAQIDFPEEDTVSHEIDESEDDDLYSLGDFTI